ncbi:MAG TPA: class I SAM-dependent methyltransferase [Chitinophagaceae bacterium]|jgi:SAM-dependent methyltransferase|nr:class I SAM-dependent methyltransferase [Chitinophagaceae bacterium]
MSSINNQQEYWDSVAATKTFTHPLDAELVNNYFKKNFRILDYGSGYGRLTNEFYTEGFVNITGVDTSSALIKRGTGLFPGLNFLHIDEPPALKSFDNNYDAVVLFAVLTCIPSNAGQKDLINILSNRLKKGGFLYISDYYLQKDRLEVGEYGYFNNDLTNYGVFSLPEGAMFRHHTKQWIKELLKDLEIVSEKIIPVKTMNGHPAEAFQILVRK